jgi:GT2 family glycosyltransferase
MGLSSRALEALWSWLAALPFEHHLRQRDAAQVVGRWRAETDAAARAPAQAPVAMLLDVGSGAADAERTLASWAAQTVPSAWAVLGASGEPCVRTREALGLPSPLFAGEVVDVDSLAAAGVAACFVASPGELLHGSLAGIVGSAFERGAGAVAWDRIEVERAPAGLRWTRRRRGPGHDPVAEAKVDLRGNAFALPLEAWRGHAAGATFATRVRHAPPVKGWHVHPEPLALVPSPTAALDPAAGVAALERRYGVAFASDAGERPRPAAVPRRISVVLLYRDRPELTVAAIDSVEAQRTEAMIELVLVDNDSLAESRAAIEARLARLDPAIAVVRVAFPGAFNHSAQCMLAASRASGDVLLFLNNDARLLDRSALDAMGRWALAPGIATVGVRLVDGERTVGGGFRLRRVPGPEFNSPVEEETGDIARWDRETTGNSFACAAVAAPVFASIGLDARRFPIGYNDVDFCLRAARSGLVHVNLGSIAVEHRVGASRAKIDEILQKLFLRQEHAWTATAALRAHDLEALPSREFAAPPDPELPRE